MEQIKSITNSSARVAAHESEKKDNNPSSKTSKTHDYINLKQNQLHTLHYENLYYTTHTSQKLKNTLSAVQDKITKYDKSERFTYLTKLLSTNPQYIERKIYEDIQNDVISEYGFEDVSNLPKMLLLMALIREYKLTDDYVKLSSNTCSFVDDKCIRNIALSARDKSLLQPIASEFNRNTPHFDNFGEKYKMLLTIRYNTLPNFVRPLFVYLINMLYGPYGEDTWMDILKDFGTICLRHYIEDSYPSWILYFVELHMLSGYDTVKHTSPNPHVDCKAFWSERELDVVDENEIMANAKKLIDNIEIKKLTLVTPENFFSFRDNIAIFGSSNYGEKFEMKTQGLKKKFSDRTKFSTLLSVDQDTLMKDIMTIKPHEIKIFLKTDELAKTRFVMGYDALSFYRCTYLYYFLGNLNAHDGWTTIDMNPNQISAVHKTELSDIQADVNRYYICTDQSAFDQHVYKSIFIKCFEYLCEKITKKNPQAKDLVDVELRSLEQAYFNVDGVKYPWKNGLCSGHKMTGLLGSVINGAVSLTVSKRLKLTPLRYRFQGDDAYMVFQNKADKTKIAEEYKKLDLVVNPMKTWSSSDRFEYLHQIYSENGTIRSLPNRGLTGLIWRNPKSVEVGALNFINSMIDTISMVARRGNSVRRSGFRFIRNYLMNNSENLSSRLIYGWMHTPRCVGGVGLFPYVKPARWVTISSQQNKKEGVGESHILSQINYRPIMNMEKWIIKRMYDHIPKPGIKHTLQLIRVADFSKFVFRTTNDRVKFNPRMNFDPRLPDNSENYRRRILFEIGELSLEYNGHDISTRYNDYISLKSKNFQYATHIREIRSKLIDREWKDKMAEATRYLNYGLIYSSLQIQMVKYKLISQILTFINQSKQTVDPSPTNVKFQNSTIVYYV